MSRLKCKSHVGNQVLKESASSTACLGSQLRTFLAILLFVSLGLMAANKPVAADTLSDGLEDLVLAFGTPTGLSLDCWSSGYLGIEHGYNHVGVSYLNNSTKWFSCRVRPVLHLQTGGKKVEECRFLAIPASWAQNKYSSVCSFSAQSYGTGFALDNSSSPGIYCLAQYIDCAEINPPF